MKKMMDPVWEAEKIIEAYIGGKPRPRGRKRAKRGRGTYLLLGALFLSGAGTALALYLL